MSQVPSEDQHVLGEALVDAVRDLLLATHDDEFTEDELAWAVAGILGVWVAIGAPEAARQTILYIRRDIP